MKYIIYIDKNGEHRWQLVARNNRIIADSAEGHKTLNQCYKMIDKIQKGGYAIFEE